MPRRDPAFFAGAWAATAPLWLWALQFGVAYVGTAVGCQAGLGATPLRAALLAITAAALATGAWLLWRACRAMPAQPGLLVPVRRAVALLALLGMAWTAVPLLLLGPCGLA